VFLPSGRPFAIFGSTALLYFSIDNNQRSGMAAADFVRVVLILINNPKSFRP
jgi:hypothetical protein